MSGAFAGDQEFKRPFKDGLNEKIETMSERISKCWEILKYAFYFYYRKYTNVRSLWYDNIDNRIIGT